MHMNATVGCANLSYCERKKVGNMDKHLKNKKEKYNKMFMTIAETVSEMSFCERRKVGAILVKNGQIISMGWNGTPAGEDNCCEEKHYSSGDEGGWLDHETAVQQWPFVEWVEEFQRELRYSLKTKPDVIHAEENCLRKLITSTETSVDSTMYVTTAPCKMCAVRLKDAKVKEVFYLEVYRSEEGIKYLEKHGIHTEQIQIKSTKEKKSC